jgi:hypothetical protein
VIGTKVAWRVRVEMTMVRSKHARVDVRFGQGWATPRGKREVTAFARYCVARIERDLGAIEQWNVDVAATSGGFQARVEARDRRWSREARAIGRDRTLAIWDAMCALEQRLRERT